MADPNIATSRLIGVETPSIVLPFINCFADVLVVADLDTFILLQSTSAPHLATACSDTGSSVRVTVRGVRRWSRRTLSCVCAHQPTHTHISRMEDLKSPVEIPESEEQTDRRLFLHE